MSTAPSPSLLACLHKFLPHPHVYKCISPDFKLIVIWQNCRRLEGTLLSYESSMIVRGRLAISKQCRVGRLRGSS